MNKHDKDCELLGGYPWCKCDSRGRASLQYPSYDALRAELAQVKQERDEARSERNALLAGVSSRNKEIATLRVSATRPEPSRLEIAAMFYVSFIGAGGLPLNSEVKQVSQKALMHADALIAEARKEEAK